MKIIINKDDISRDMEGQERCGCAGYGDHLLLVKIVCMAYDLLIMPGEHSIHSNNPEKEKGTPTQASWIVC
jgi:hypothetical protein